MLIAFHDRQIWETIQTDMITLIHVNICDCRDGAISR